MNIHIRHLTSKLQSRYTWSIKKLIIIFHSPPPKNNSNETKLKATYLQELKKKKKISLSFILLYHMLRQMRSNSFQPVLSLESPSPHSTFNTHHLTNFLGAPKGFCSGPKATHAQLPFGISLYLLAYLIDSQTYAHVCRASGNLLPTMTGEGYWVFTPGRSSSQAPCSHIYQQTHQGSGWC